jgi:hypothetical protein
MGAALTTLAKCKLELSNARKKDHGKKISNNF